MSRFFEHRGDFWIRHEVFPDEAGAVVFDYDDDWDLIQSHVDPVGAGIDQVRSLHRVWDWQSRKRD